MKTLNLFVDTSYLLALYNPKDQYHKRAVTIKEKITVKHKLWITEAVLTEIGNSWSSVGLREKACILIESCYKLSSVIVIPSSDVLFQKSFSLYRARQDKNWSLTDCMSFVVMQENRLTEVLTTDEHFQQAGFSALLL